MDYGRGTLITHGKLKFNGESGEGEDREVGEEVLSKEKVES